MPTGILTLALLTSGAQAQDASAAATPVEKAFTCTQVTWTDPGTEIVLSGTMVAAKSRPTYLEVTNERSGSLIVDRTAPPLFNRYDGGYWFTTYGWNTWRVGKSGITNYYFLLHTGRTGTSFSAEVHEVFDAAGWIELEMDCTML